MKCCVRSVAIALLLLLGIGAGIVFFKPVPPLDSSCAAYHHAGSKPDAKRILILSTTGGGGNMAGARAITEYLENDYAVATTCAFSNVLTPLGLSRNGVGDMQSSVGMYDYTLQKKWYWITSLLAQAGSVYFKLRRNTIITLLVDFLKQSKPDLVISVAPFINSMILEATQKLNLPFLLIPTDLDTTVFIEGIRNPTYPQFHLALAFDEGMLTKLSKPAGIAPENIHITGFPVRKQFLANKKQLLAARKSMRRELDIPERKPTVLLLMGALGSQEIPSFVRWLSKSHIPLHIIAAIGKSEHLHKPLSSMQLPSHITMSVVGYTNNMAGLMAASDLLLTKSGTVSVSEGIYMDLPMILDATTRVLPWEQINHRFVETFGLGVSLKRAYDIPQLINGMLAGERQRLNIYKENMNLFAKKDPKVEIPKLVKLLLEA